jgi:hypothetical protein
VACGLWLVACGLWLVACGLWLVACGLWHISLKLFLSNKILSFKKYLSKDFLFIYFYNFSKIYCKKNIFYYIKIQLNLD